MSSLPTPATRYVNPGKVPSLVATSIHIREEYKVSVGHERSQGRIWVEIGVNTGGVRGEYGH